MKISEIVINPEEGTIDRYFVGGTVRKNIGTITNYGYKQVNLNYKRRLVHRLVWEFVNGSIPKNMEIDHIDGDRLNNKITNLRLVNRSQNNQNQLRSHRDNKSECKGCHGLPLTGDGT